MKLNKGTVWILCSFAVACFIYLGYISSSSYTANINYTTPTATPGTPDAVLTSDEVIKQIRSNCRKHNMSITWNVTTSQFPRLILLQNGIAYTVNPKTGSTSFRMFLKEIYRPKRIGLIPRSIRRYIHYGHMGRHRTPAQHVDKLLGRQFKFVFIRNPLVKILSGFRDKVLRKGHFVRKGAHWGASKHPPNATEEKIFSLFIKNLINYNGNQRHMIAENIHFRRQYQALSVCHYPYNFIGQVELARRDIPLMQGLSNTAHFKYPGSRTEKGKDKESTVELANRFWGSLEPELLQRVYEYYKLDFELLGYPRLNETDFPYITKHRV